MVVLLRAPVESLCCITAAGLEFMSELRYIGLAMNHPGSELTIKQAMPGKSIYHAILHQPGEKDVKSGISMTIVGALGALDGLLQQDYEQQQKTKT